MQAVWDYEDRFTKIVARWLGSAHDSRIFNESLLKRELEAVSYGTQWLLGDNGYVNIPIYSNLKCKICIAIWSEITSFIREPASAHTSQFVSRRHFVKTNWNSRFAKFENFTSLKKSDKNNQWKFE